MKDKQSLTSYKSIIIGIVVALAVGAGGFFGGMQYQKSKVPSFAGRGSGNVRGQFSQGDDHQPGQDGFRGRFSGRGQPVTGEVIAKDDESITVKVEDGGSKIVFISDTTTVRKTDEGNLNDLVEGTQVLIFGSENADGSITAENIQLNPEFRVDHSTENEQDEPSSL